MKPYPKSQETLNVQSNYIGLYEKIVRYGIQQIKQNRFVLLILFTTFFLNINCGTDFFALQLPEGVKKEISEIQNYIKSQLNPDEVEFLSSSTENLHITLKEIGNLNDKEREFVLQFAELIGKIIKPFDLSKQLAESKIYITKNNLILLKLADSKEATNLAYSLNDSLKILENNDTIAELFPRMDFPDKSHITIGVLQAKAKAPADAITKNVANIFENLKINLKSEFPIDKFVLLKSNRPQEPRVYTVMGTIALSKPIEINK